MASSLPVVALIGRPNVGKSTLFNRILGHRNAIVDDRPGVTRDRIYATCTYQGHAFQLVDTGGLDPSSSEGMLGLVRRQSQLALEEANVVIMLMDGRAGLTPLDLEIIELLRTTAKPVFFAINKLDTPQAEPLMADFYQVGHEHLYPISAEQGLGIDELLEAILPLLPQESTDSTTPEIPRVAIVGRPNVGKSTLVNTILGQERIIVSPTPGTTRDPIDTLIEYKGRSYLFTDTAGIRRRGRIERGIEGYSVVRALRALGRSDIALLLLDGVEGPTEQDTKIAGLILRQGRGCIILVNKWDQVQSVAHARDQYAQRLARRFAFFSFAPVLYGSALDAQTADRLFPLIDTVMDAFTTRIPTGRLNQFLQQALTDNPLPLKKGRPTKSVFMTQVATKPPTFALFVSPTAEVGAAYLRYLENRLRAAFSFEGTPIRILVRPK
ncbi:MAG: ribosome biogenesis GTPase Der [Nitrospirae bacterium]|nr:MAG: ribosome biogenesis GTPase Der [Nitrospirota bacterium]